MLRPIWIVAFSGHRPKAGEPGRSREELAACRGPLRVLLTELRHAAADAGGSIELLGSLAEGGDQLAIGVADELGIPVHLMLPMPRRAFEMDFASQDPVEAEHGRKAWIEAQRFMAKADDPRSDWTIRVTSGDNEPPGCYHDTNLEMLESADLLVALCREDLAAPAAPHAAPATIGSTAEAIRMASKDRLAVPTIILDPARGGAIIRRDQLRFDGDAERCLREMIDLMESPLAQPSPSSPAADQRGGEETLWSVHHALDHVANHSSRHSRSAITRAMWLHLGAALLAAFSAAFVISLKGTVLLHPRLPLPAAITALELLLVSIAMWTLWRVHRAHINPHWRSARFGAEVADSELRAAGLIDPLRPVVSRHAGEWKRFALTLSLAAHRQKLSRLSHLDEGQRLESLRQAYLKHRIEHQADRYLAKARTTAARTLRRWGAAGRWCSAAAVLFVALALVLKLGWPDASKSGPLALLTLFLPIVLPVVASFASARIISTDAVRRAARFRQVGERLDHLRTLITAARTAAGLRRIVIETEDILLDELIEWYASAKALDHVH
jgi:ABC-type nickel/cobalt efflux system permease component RcnA